VKTAGLELTPRPPSGPDSNGSQFFISLAPTQWLDGKHAIFGRVHQGMLSVKRMGQVEVDHNDRPVDDVRIEKGSVLMQ
jgi:peptidyl-prolyl cis-trans isomerase-like 1